MPKWYSYKKSLHLSQIMSYLYQIFRIGSRGSSKLQIYCGWYPPSATRCLVVFTSKSQSLLPQKFNVLVDYWGYVQPALLPPKNWDFDITNKPFFSSDIILLCKWCFKKTRANSWPFLAAQGWGWVRVHSDCNRGVEGGIRSQFFYNTAHP